MSQSNNDNKSTGAPTPNMPKGPLFLRYTTGSLGLKVGNDVRAVVSKQLY